MARYRAAIDAGGDIAEITGWINATKADRLQAEAALRGTSAPVRMTKDEIRSIGEHFASLAAVIRSADPAAKAEIYRGINLMLKYQPGAQIVQAKAQLTTGSHGVMVGVRGANAPK